MRLRTRLLVLLITMLIAGIIPALLAAQTEEEESFLPGLVREMAILGWPENELAEVERNLYTYRWEKVKGVDPEIVAVALQYGRDRGDLDDDPELIADLALEISESAAEMTAMGMSSREIARVSLSGVREMIQDRSRDSYDQDSDDDASDLGTLLRSQLQNHLRETQEQELRTELKTRMNNPHDPETWSPGKPDSSPVGTGVGKPDDPGNPGGSSGPPETTQGEGGSENTGEAVGPGSGSENSGDANGPTTGPGGSDASGGSGGSTGSEGVGNSGGEKE